MAMPLIVGNWKMNLLTADATELALCIKEFVEKITDVRVVLAPSFTLLHIVNHILLGSKVGLASQNFYFERKGAYTGEVSAEMLKSIGVNTTLIGHSERRAYYNEDDELLLNKLKHSIECGMNVIFCFGEELSDRKSQNHFTVVKNQLDNTVMKVDKSSWKKIILAYEPVWAIGTGETASAEQAQEMHEYVRKCISESFGKEISNNVSILYGGSVKPNNASEIFSKKDVDGGLIGGAALNASDFSKIVESNR